MEKLNDAQRKAATAEGKAVLVLAGAGTGKTRVIVERLAWLIGERGVDPRRILALTFTNRAADEMRTRVMSRSGVEKLASYVGTFHAFALYVLRREIDRLGRDKAFTVFDAADQQSLMKRLIDELPSGHAKVTPREALSWISRRKQSLEDPAANSSPRTPLDQTRRLLWTAYHDTLARMNCVDFDDLLLLLAKLLDAHADVRERYQQRYRYIHVDEYQDTNRAQYHIARRLSENDGVLFVVGDEDQGIYSWRGADIENILQFKRDFPDADILRLEQNYRSTAAILSAANAVVAHNVERLGKKLWTQAAAGAPVRLYEADDGDEEARFVAEEVGKLSGESVGVLFRTNAQARLLEEALRRKKIAYIVVGGIQFYGRKEIKDLIAYLRLLVNPSDDVSLRRIINVPPRGLGAATLQRLDEYARARGCGLLQVLRDIEQDHTFTARAREGAHGLTHLMDDLALLANEGKVTPVFRALADRTRYREFVEHSKEEDWRTRLEMIGELESACVQFDEGGAGGLQTFLQELSLLTDSDMGEAQRPKVALMTCHCAKGLEFDHVFLVGLEDGLLPHISALGSQKEMEEERRLCYVAMTRARKRLTLAAAAARVLNGEHRRCKPSQFLAEIPQGQLVLEGRTSAQRPVPVQRPATGYRPSRGHGAPSERGVARALRTEITPCPDAAPAAQQRIRRGVRVRHASFGIGVVTATEGSGASLRAHVRFDTGRVRQLMVSVAPLEILEGRGR